MKQRSAQSIRLSPLLWTGASLICWIFFAPAAFSQNSTGLVDRINNAEVKMFGMPHPERPLNDRVSALEYATNGQQGAGPLTTRLDAIESLLQITPGSGPGRTSPSAANTAARGLSDSKAIAQHSSTDIKSAQTTGMPPVAPPRGQTFQNPVFYNGARPLQAGATEYGAPAYQGNGQFQNPLHGQAQAARPIVPPMPNVQASATSLAGAAATGGIGTRQLLNAAGLNSWNVINALHCPICRLLH